MMRGNIFCVILVCSVWIITNGGCLAQFPGIPKTEKRLRTFLQNEKGVVYDMAVRPAWPTPVLLKYQLISVQALDIASQSFSHTGFFTFTWEDSRLIWLPSAYDGIENLAIDWVWRPSFLVVNGIETLIPYGVGQDLSAPRVFYNGTVRWSGLLDTTTSCNVSGYYFPYDTQTCNVIAAFWDHNYGVNLIVGIDQYEIGLLVYLKNGGWEYVSSTSHVRNFTYCCPDTSVGLVIFGITFKRARLYYIYTLITPPILLSACIALTFLLPPDYTKRLGYSLTIQLSYTIFLTTTASLIPAQAMDFPYIASHLVRVLILTTLALFSVVVNIRLYSMKSTPPKAIRAIYSLFRKCKCCGCPSQKRSDYENLDETDYVNESVQMVDYRQQQLATSTTSVCSATKTNFTVTWQQIAKCADVVCFVLYTACVLFNNVALMTTLAEAD